MRVFVAIDLPEDVKASIFHYFEKLKNSGLVSGNFVEKNNLHLTLNFLGDLNLDEIEKIKKVLSGIKYEKFDGEIDGIGFFPNENHVKVIWVGFKSDKLKSLKDKIDNELGKIGISGESKNFESHVTVARINFIKNKDIFLERIKDIKIKKMKFSVKEFILVKSELKRNGPEYKILDRFELK